MENSILDWILFWKQVSGVLEIGWPEQILKEHFYEHMCPGSYWCHSIDGFLLYCEKKDKKN